MRRSNHFPFLIVLLAPPMVACSVLFPFDDLDGKQAAAPGSETGGEEVGTQADGGWDARRPDVDARVDGGGDGADNVRTGQDTQTNAFWTSAGTSGCSDESALYRCEQVP